MENIWICAGILTVHRASYHVQRAEGTVVLEHRRKLVIHQPPPRVGLRPALQEIVVERLHGGIRVVGAVVGAVVQYRHVGVVDAQIGHDFGRDFGPAIDDHGDNGLQRSLQLLWAYIERALLQRLREMRSSLGVGVVQIFHAFLVRVIGIMVIDGVKKSYCGFEVTLDRKGLVRHDCSVKEVLMRETVIEDVL